jgi:hypothetical protein
MSFDHSRLLFLLTIIKLELSRKRYMLDCYEVIKSSEKEKKNEREMRTTAQSDCIFRVTKQHFKATANGRNEY